MSRYSSDELKALGRDKEVGIHKYTPSFDPQTITVISVRSTYEKSDLWIESSEEFDSYFLSLVSEAKAIRPSFDEE